MRDPRAESIRTVDIDNAIRTVRTATLNQPMREITNIHDIQRAHDDHNDHDDDHDENDDHRGRYDHDRQGDTNAKHTHDDDVAGVRLAKPVRPPNIPSPTANRSPPHSPPPHSLLTQSNEPYVESTRRCKLSILGSWKWRRASEEQRNTQLFASFAQEFSSGDR